MRIGLGKSAEIYKTPGIHRRWRRHFEGDLGCILFLKEARCDSTAYSEENARAAKACSVRPCSSRSGKEGKARMLHLSCVAVLSCPSTLWLDAKHDDADDGAYCRNNRSDNLQCTNQRQAGRDFRRGQVRDRWSDRYLKM